MKATVPKIRDILKALAVLIGCGIFCVGLGELERYKEEQANWILAGFLVVPGLAIVWPRAKLLERSLRGLIACIFWFGLYAAYFAVKDRLAITPQCPECAFSFENDPLFEHAALACVISMILGHPIGWFLSRSLHR